MTPNGPAIKGVCVGRRMCRFPSLNFSQKAITAQGGHGAVFGIQVQTFGPIRVSRYKVAKWVVNCHPAEVLKGGTRAVSRYKFDRSQKFIKLQDFNYEHRSVSRLIAY